MTPPHMFFVLKVTSFRQQKQSQSNVLRVLYKIDTPVSCPEALLRESFALVRTKL